MPRKKISIAEAMATLKEHGLDVTVMPTVPVVPPVQASASAVRRIGNNAVTITLYAMHTIGNGGTLEIDESGHQQIVNNGVTAYGPGVVTVPTRVANQLLHQDQLARQADDRFLDRTQRSYLITQRVSSSGQRAHVGVQVANSLMDGFDIGSVGNNMIMV